MEACHLEKYGRLFKIASFICGQLQVAQHDVLKWLLVYEKASEELQRVQEAPTIYTVYIIIIKHNLHL